jgi:hypothetical protein
MAVKMIAEYLEHALQFERMAAEAADPSLKASLGSQAVAYRNLAAERAERVNPAPPPCSRCGSPTTLARIEPAKEPDHDLRTFECRACGNIDTVTVKFR